MREHPHRGLAAYRGTQADLDKAVAELVNDPARIVAQAEKAWQYGKKSLDIGTIRASLKNDMEHR